MKQWANLDLLRSIAVLLVVNAHLVSYTMPAAHFSWNGTTGVCFFFVHTSLVLMWSLERDPHVGRFYVRRIFRIYPLWLVVFALVILARLPISPLFYPHFGFHEPGSGKEWIAEILLLFNLRFGASVVGASWTLPVEVDMYLFLPALFFFIRGARALWPLLAFFGFFILWNYEVYPADSPILPVCVPYFLSGIMAYHLSKKVRARVPSWLFPIFLGLLTAAGSRYCSYRGGWGFCLVLGLALPHFKQMTWPPLLRASHLVARYSYGIYLCHFIAIALGFHLAAKYALPVRIAVFAATLVLLPVILYHLVEEPMIRFGAKLAKRIQPGPAPAMNEQALNFEPAP